MILYLEEHAYQQISEILGISETNVATKIARIKQRVRLEASKEETEQR
jgi:DNA-directed RNA polymerase specialized sigma24 family protein